METKSDAAEIAAIRTKVSEVFGKKPESPKDFEALATAIWEKGHEIISPTTLKRIWGYITGGVTVRRSSLDIIARYVGMKDWDDFVIMQQMQGEVESYSFAGEGVNVSDLKAGESVVVTWLPNRRCVFRYQGEGNFVVTHSRYSKLRVGDRFVAACFIIGEPLYLDKLQRKGVEGETSYVAGKEHGITSVMIDK